MPGPGSTFLHPVPAGATALNGAGELTGFLQISEWGLIETPIYLTSTMAVGRVFDGAVSAACVTCHNGHPLSPKQDFKLNDVIGGIAITIPLE